MGRATSNLRTTTTLRQQAWTAQNSKPWRTGSENWSRYSLIISAIWASPTRCSWRMNGRSGSTVSTSLGAGNTGTITLERCSTTRHTVGGGSSCWCSACSCRSCPCSRPSFLRTASTCNILLGVIENRTFWS